MRGNMVFIAAIKKEIRVVGSSIVGEMVLLLVLLLRLLLLLSPILIFPLNVWVSPFVLTLRMDWYERWRSSLEKSTSLQTYTGNLPLAYIYKVF